MPTTATPPRSAAAPISIPGAPARISSTRRSTSIRSGRASIWGSSRAASPFPGIGTITNLALLAQALETDAKANILSTPNLLTLDNEEAKIIVAQNVPFITGQYAQTGSTSTVTPFQTIERQDVGLILTVKPQITEGGSVRMAIYEEVSSIASQTNPAGIITNKRSLASSVIVDDGQIIVLGGLIQDSLTDNANQVPFLGDIPYLGTLFRYDNREHIKTNLMVFLKPTVVRSNTAANSVTSDRYEYLMGEQQRIKPTAAPFWTEPNVPLLPPLTLPLPANSGEPLPGVPQPVVPQPGGVPPHPQ